ncbi:hypothetical protein [Polyangium spumosum]|uniref:Uncharacterized protein n=1 Tax=Polyangium spumosum TaxID=889282 RepID=A0A6N7PNV3_9BACT|nr:hypothetical protein [Polyangium spumosum]MRG93703.1 hypothetical protein [Polyangium spumosum]
MRDRAKWMCGIAATLAAMVSVVGCIGDSVEYGPCPKDRQHGVSCFWEGGITFEPDRVSQADGFVFVHGEMTWGPCAMTPGKQIRSYRINPADGSTTQMDAPANAEPVAIPAEGMIEVVPTGSMRRVRIDPDAVISVTQSKLPIGEVLDEATGMSLAVIELAAVCDG